MQPSPMADTSRLLFPSLRFFIAPPYLLLDARQALRYAKTPFYAQETPEWSYPSLLRCTGICLLRRTLPARDETAVSNTRNAPCSICACRLKISRHDTASAEHASFCFRSRCSHQEPQNLHSLYSRFIVPPKRDSRAPWY